MKRILKSTVLRSVIVRVLYNHLTVLSLMTIFGYVHD